MGTQNHICFPPPPPPRITLHQGTSWLNSRLCSWAIGPKTESQGRSLSAMPLLPSASPGPADPALRGWPLCVIPFCRHRTPARWLSKQRQQGCWMWGRCVCYCAREKDAAVWTGDSSLLVTRFEELTLYHFRRFKLDVIMWNMHMDTSFHTLVTGHGWLFTSLSSR